MTDEIIDLFTEPDGPYHPIRGGDGLRVPGIWRRKGAFYARDPRKNMELALLVKPNGMPCTSVLEARKAQEFFREEYSDDVPPVSEIIERFLTRVQLMGDYSPSTIRGMKTCFRFLEERCGNMRIIDFGPSALNSWLEHRKSVSDVGNRSLNRDIIFCRQMTKFAFEEGFSIEDTLKGFKPLKYKAPRQALVSQADVDLMVKKAEGIWLLPEFINFLRYSGARKNEALYAKWEDVDWERGGITFPTTKNGRPRFVDFNPPLKELLTKMHANRPSLRNYYIFPGRRRSAKRGAKITVGSHLVHDYFKLVKKLGLSCGIHSLRHYFVSACVMAGIDYLTIAEWVGHQDRGVLIASVYGHLNQSHKREMATKLHRM